MAHKKRKQQHQYQQAAYDFKNILTGSDLSARRIALMKLESHKAGPVVWLSAAIHGDEVGGIIVVHEIFKQLRSCPLVQGSVHAMPIMNPIGFETSARHITLSDEDLNRSFPGDPHGKLSERIAHKIFKTIFASHPSLVIDLHNDWRKSIPYLLLDPLSKHRYRTTYRETVRLARATGLLIVEEQEHDENVLIKTLSGSLMNAGIPAFTLELGESFVINEKDVRNGVVAIWNILRALQMVKDDLPFQTTVKYPSPFRKEILTYNEGPRGQTSGLLRFLVTPGAHIVPQQPIARIYNVFGKLRETVHANTEGVLLGYTDSAMTYPGMPLVALAAHKG